MTTRRSTPAQLETYYDVKQATVKLKLAEDDPNDWRGQRWLRDGANHNGFPHSRINRKLMFSESDLAVIMALCHTPAAPHVRRKARAA
jgi:hypothetical protein